MFVSRLPTAPRRQPARHLDPGWTVTPWRTSRPGSACRSETARRPPHRRLPALPGELEKVGARAPCGWSASSGSGFSERQPAWFADRHRRQPSTAGATLNRPAPLPSAQVAAVGGVVLPDLHRGRVRPAGRYREGDRTSRPVMGQIVANARQEAAVVALAAPLAPLPVRARQLHQIRQPAGRRSGGAVPTRACFTQHPGSSSRRCAATSSRAVALRMTIGNRTPIQTAHSANSPVVDTLKGRSSVSTSHWPGDVRGRRRPGRGSRVGPVVRCDGTADGWRRHVVKRSLPRPAKPRLAIPSPGPPCHAMPRHSQTGGRRPQAASGSSITFLTSNLP